MNDKIKSPSGHGSANVGVSIGTTVSSGNGNGNVGVNASTISTTSNVISGSLSCTLPSTNNGGDVQTTSPSPHLYAPAGGGDPNIMAHYHMHQQPSHPQHIPPHSSQSAIGSTGFLSNLVDHVNKDDYVQATVIGGQLPPPPATHHPVYGRFHHDPNLDPYRYGHSPIQQQPPPPGGKIQTSVTGSVLVSPSRSSQQRYMPGQPLQGPTPTLNSLLQSSHPPPAQHRYTNSYDSQHQQHTQQQQHQQQPPVPPQSHQTLQPSGGQHSQQSLQQQTSISTQAVSLPLSHAGPTPLPAHQVSYVPQQAGWAPPPRPYSSPLGPTQQYRTPPPTTVSRVQSPYPPVHGQNSGSYSSPPQQPPQQTPQQTSQQQPGICSGGSNIGVPPTLLQSSNQGTTSTQYSPYPARYPTPPGATTGSNHRNTYSSSQYAEPNRSWTGGSSPAPSSAGHSLPPASPHHAQHSGQQPNNSPSHGPSPSPQPSQASPSPHQELIGQNSNDSSSGGHSVMGSGPPSTNAQQVTRPTPSPTGSTGSRSMSPAVASSHPISRPSSNQSSSVTMQQPSQPSIQQQQSQQSSGILSVNVGGNNVTQGPVGSNVTNNSNNNAQHPSQTPSQNINNLPAQHATSQISGPASSVYPLPPHIHGSYKLGGQSPGSQSLHSGYPPPPSIQQSHQYSQGNYPLRTQYPPSTYAPTTSQPSVINSIPLGCGSQPYSSVRPILNHSGASPYPSYQNWIPQSAQGNNPGVLAPGGSAGLPLGNHIQNKSTPSASHANGPPRTLNYLKQHLQHKSSYVPTSGPPQGYGNGTGIHPGIPMGPPHHMGPPHGSTNMGPPTSAPIQTMMCSIVAGDSNVAPSPSRSPTDNISQDNGVNTSSLMSSSSGQPHVVTSIITTGPDGTPIDEASQQSTISNASAASAEDPQCTPQKLRKSDIYGQSLLAQPSTSPSSMVGLHPGHPGVHNEEYEMNSPPNWIRTNTSPAFNSHVSQQDAFRPAGVPNTPISMSASNKKSDSLCKLYEMDDNPDRRIWLDKLRTFMDERRTPITACPTISKQPLDLYRLYLYVKDRGGFVEVTKSKTWKDIAGLLGIGASSSAAYTLRKHYTKNLLAFECHYDRGDIDPLPIIQQVEAGTKKKSTKAASVPSPAGSSNSQDSFPAPSATTNTSLDGYSSYPVSYSTTGSQADYGPTVQMARPPSQNNSQNQHSGSPYSGQGNAYGQYGSGGEQYNASGPPGTAFAQQGQFPPQNRNIYSPYGPEGESTPSGANQYGSYGNRSYSQPPPTVTSQTATTGPSSGTPGCTSATSSASASISNSYSSAGPNQQDYYRSPDQNPQPRRHPDFVKDTPPYSNYNARPQIYGGWQTANQYRNQYPSTPSSQSWGTVPPRTGAVPSGPLGPSSQQSSNSAVAPQWEQHRYTQQHPQQPSTPTQQQSPYQHPQQTQQQSATGQWAQMSTIGTSGLPPVVAPVSSLRAPTVGQQQRMSNNGTLTNPSMPINQQCPQICSTNNNAVNNSIVPSSKPAFSTSLCNNTNSPSGGNNTVAGSNNSSGMTSIIGSTPKVVNVGGPIPQQQQTAFPQFAKKEIVFPPGSVEAITPVLYRRKRLSKADICPIDPWRLFMAIRSGLLSECTWALDILNVLLFDDSTVQYFGLTHLPGLLTLLLEHFQKNLSEMFMDDGEDERIHTEQKKDSKSSPKLGSNNNISFFEYKLKQKTVVTNTENKSVAKDINLKLEDHIMSNQHDEKIDLGQVCIPPVPEERVVLLAHTPNYTMMSRKGLSVRLQPAEYDIFVTDTAKSWDFESDGCFEESSSACSNAWTYGYTDHETNAGIIDVFKSEIINIPFARYIKCINNERCCNTECYKNRIMTNNHSVDLKHVNLETNRNETNVMVDGINLHNQQMVFHKKRRMFINNKVNSDNSSSCNLNNSGQLLAEPSEAKKSKLHIKKFEDIQQENAIVSVEFESKSDTETLLASNGTDSDCREVDMDLEMSINSYKDDEDSKTVMTKNFDPTTTARDPAFILQRRRSPFLLEDECYTRDESSLHLVNESQDSLARRCICISNIFRNLSFVPGNESILAKSTRFLAVLGRVLLLYHEHLPRLPKNRNYDRSTEEDTDVSDSCSSLQGEREWWWEYLITIRENMLVVIANIAGHLELTRYEELIARPLVDGLLHWAICPSAHGQDPFPSCGPMSSLSPQRLALEALCKLCVTDNNVDLVIATPPFARLEKLCAVLTRHLCRNEDQVLREFSVNLLHYLAAADSAIARTVALQSPCVSYLVAFIEQAEQTALGVANQHGINYLRENPDSMGTSLDMLRRAAGTLLHLAKHPDNRSLFMQQEQRLLGLVMSHILDQQVALIISRVLFQISRGPGITINILEYRLQQKQYKTENVDRKDEKYSIQTSNTIVMTSKSGEKHMDTSVSTIESMNINSNDTTSMITEGINHNTNSNKCSTNINGNCNNKIVTLSGTVTMVSADSENSNSSLQTTATPSAAYNDISNSSTNSNSCGTVVSSQSIVSNISSNSNNIGYTSSNSSTLTENSTYSIAVNMHSNNIDTSEQLNNMLSSALSVPNTVSSIEIPSNTVCMTQIKSNMTSISPTSLTNSECISTIVSTLQQTRPSLTTSTTTTLSSSSSLSSSPPLPPPPPSLSSSITATTTTTGGTSQSTNVNTTTTAVA